MKYFEILGVGEGVVMRSQDYLRQAADALRQAAIARKQEMNDLRHELDMEDQETHRRLNELKQHEGERLTRAAVTTSGIETASRTREAQRMRDEESRLSHQYDHDKRRTDQRLSDMQNNINSWNQQAQNLDTQSRM